MKNTYPVMILILGCLTACGPSHLYKGSTLIGRPEAEVFQEWGAPDKSIALEDGSKFITYEIRNTSGGTFGLWTFEISKDGIVKDHGRQ